MLPFPDDASVLRTFRLHLFEAFLFVLFELALSKASQVTTKMN